MTSFPSALLRRSPLLPEEALRSLLIRLGTLNFYDPPSILYQLCGENLPDTTRRHLWAPRNVTLFERIAALTKLLLAELYRATEHRFSTIITPPPEALDTLDLPGLGNVPLLGPVTAQRHLRPFAAGQWCPACLQEAVYDRLHWQLVPLAACLDHRCLLHHRCPHCQRPVSVSQILALTCGRCEADLTTAPLISVAHDAWGLAAQRILRSWFMEDDSLLPDAQSLPARPPRTLFRVLDGLRLSATVAEPTWTHLHPLPAQDMLGVRHARDTREHPTPAQSYYLYATAMKGLVDWPNGFVTWLQAYSDRGAVTRRGQIGGDLGAVYHQWIEEYWQHADFQFLQDVFDQYLIEHYRDQRSILQGRRYRQNPDFVAKFGYMSLAEAASLLGVAPKTVLLLMAKGRVIGHKDVRNADRTVTFVRRADVEAIRAEWQTLLSLDQAADLLGLSPTITVDLVSVGLLTAERGPSVGDTVQWRFTPQAVTACSERVIASVRTAPAAYGFAVQLVQAAQMLAPVGLTVARILQRLADGKLHGYRRAAQDRQLGTIRFGAEDIRRCLEQVKEEQGWITRDDAARHLKVKHATLAGWIKHGLIRTVVVHGNAHYFDREDVTTFWERYIPADKAGEIIGIGRMAVQAWVRDGRLRDLSVSGPHLDGYRAYLFDRERLIAWRWARLSVGETQKLLRVSRATVHRYVVEGRLTPLDQRRGAHEHRWFARTEAEALRRARQESSLS